MLDILFFIVMLVLCIILSGISMNTNKESILKYVREKLKKGEVLESCEINWLLHICSNKLFNEIVESCVTEISKDLIQEILDEKQEVKESKHILKNGCYIKPPESAEEIFREIASGYGIELTVEV